MSAEVSANPELFFCYSVVGMPCNTPVKTLIGKENSSLWPPATVTHAVHNVHAKHRYYNYYRKIKGIQNNKAEPARYLRFERVRNPNSPCRSHTHTHKAREMGIEADRISESIANTCNLLLYTIIHHHFL